jgi:oligosaccharide repeat unit polymerase
MEELILLTVLFLLWIYAYKSTGRISSPSSVSIIVFTLLYVVNRFGILKYSYEFELRHGLYVVLVLLCFIFTFAQGMRRIKRSRQPVETGICNTKFIALISLVGAMGGIALILDTIRSTGIDAFFKGSLNLVRDLYNERVVGIFGQVGSVLYGLSLPAVILSARVIITRSAPRRQCRLLLFQLIGLGLIIFLVSFTSGGRQAILEYVLSLVAVMLYTDKAGMDRKLVARLKVSFLLVFSAIILYFTRVIESRAADGMANVAGLLSLFRAEYKDWYLLYISDHVPEALSLFLTVLHCYYPYNLVTLAVYIDEIGFGTGLMYGGYQAVHFLRQLSKIGFEWPFVVNFSNVDRAYDGYIAWVTFLGGLLLDFGKIGLLIVVAALGWFAGKYYGLYIHKNSMIGFWFTCLMFVFIIHSVMYSPFIEILLLYGLIWTFILKNKLYKRSARSIREKNMQEQETVSISTVQQ